MGREDTTDHGVRVMFTSCRAFKQTKIYVFMFCIICFILYKQSLTVLVSLNATEDMCWFGVCWGHGPYGECERLGSETRRIFFYASLVAGGLRSSGSSSGRTGSVRVYIRVMRTLYR
jgi:hypothetical protein